MFRIKVRCWVKFIVRVRFTVKVRFRVESSR
jgi:hypothetical protein